MIKKIRHWVIVKLAGKDSIALNLSLCRGLYFDKGNINGLYVNVNIKHRDGLPDKVAFYFVK